MELCVVIIHTNPLTITHGWKITGYVSSTNRISAGIFTRQQSEKTAPAIELDISLSAVITIWRFSLPATDSWLRKYKNKNGFDPTTRDIVRKMTALKTSDKKSETCPNMKET